MPDKDEVPGSSPGRPTTQPSRSERCRQRAGSVRCRLGPRWGRTPIPAGTSRGLSGAAHPGRQARRRPRTVVAPQPEDGSHAAGAATSRCSPPRAHSAAARDGRSARRPDLPGRSARTRGRRGPHPTRRPGSATDLPPTNATAAAWPHPGLPRPSIEPSTARQPHGPPPVPVRVARPARPGFPTPPPEHGRRRTRPDRRGQTPDGWTPHGWTADGWTLDGWTADGRPPDSLDDDPR
jgi:hypothetical protein